MTEPIRITKRTIDHNDPAAAGFTDGWWWEVDTPHYGTIESGCATEQEARAAAEAVARARPARSALSR